MLIHSQIALESDCGDLENVERQLEGVRKCFCQYDEGQSAVLHSM